MAISIVTGLPGHGKTSKLCEWAVKSLMDGHTVYTNFKMHNLPEKLASRYHHFKEPLEVLGRVSNAKVYISEAGIQISDYVMHELPNSFWEFASQHRKDGVDIICDAQKKSQIAWRFWNLVQYQYHIYASFRVTPKRKLALVRCFDPQPKGMDYGRRYWLQDPYYFKFYDTHYKLEKTQTLYDIGQEQIMSPYAQYQYDQYERVLLLNKNIQNSAKTPLTPIEY